MPHDDHEINRAAWNQRVDLHVNHFEYRTQEVINGGSSLKRLELEALGDVTGKRLLHLMCQFGLDTLSWAREGAIVTGVDIADRSIEVANEIKKKAELEAQFIRCDVLDLIGTIDSKFDIVFQSYGTHCWVSDIRKWAEVVTHYLKPGGTFFMIDGHPLEPLFLFPEDNINYFDVGPYRYQNPPDYCQKDKFIDGESVEWQHTVSDLVNALIDAGLTIERLDEYNFGYYRLAEGWVKLDDDYWTPPGGPAEFPIMLAIRARKG